MEISEEQKNRRNKSLLFIKKIRNIYTYMKVGTEQLINVLKLC